MILLNGESLQEKARFRAESMPLNLEERNSNATVTVGPDAPEIRINDWLRDDTEPGKGIIWRVKSVRNQADTRTRTLSLEHIIQSLKDQVLFGEIPASVMANKKGAEKCTARQAITFILGRQAKNLWRLGDLCANPSNPYGFNGDSLFAALETVTGTIEGAQWEYDLSSLPFTLHIRTVPAGFQSEMRMRRNITTLSIQVDRTRMYTRHYPIGAKNLTLPGGYLSKNEDLWGVVAKVETDQSLNTQEKLRAWSQERLNRHCDPLVTVTIGGTDLSADTGEPLDRIVIGRRCRLPLPEYGTEMTETVSKISWADKITEPKKFNVTLANQQEDVAKLYNNLAGSAGKAARTGAKQSADDHAWFVDTSTHVAMVAEAVAGEGASRDWSRVAQVLVDGEGIHQRVTRAEGEVVVMWSSIEALEDRIVLEVASAKSDTYSKIEQTASSIRSEVNTAKSSLYSSIMQTATNIYTQVGNAKSDTYSKIEQTASSIRSEVNSSKSTLFSVIMQTATNIYTQVGNAKSDTYSKIEQTASTIRSEVNTAKSSLYSSIMQTSTMIYTEVGNAKSGLYSSIKQTASQITLKADKTYVDGELEGLTAKFNSITVVEGTSTYLQSGKVYATASLSVGSGNSGGSGTFYFRGNAYARNYITMKDGSNNSVASAAVFGTLANDSTADFTHYHAFTIGADPSDSSKLKITLGKPSSTEVSQNFNIADTAICKGLVSAVKVTGPTWANATGSSVSTSSNTATFSTDAPNPSSGTPKSLALLLNAASWSSGSRYVYLCQTDSTADNRVARLQVTIPNPTNIANITTYGNSAPTSNNPYSIGTVSKSGLTVGKYMSASCRFGGKTFTWYFRVES